MRTAFRDGNIYLCTDADLGSDQRLMGQLSSRKYSVQSDRTIRLESKDAIKEKGGRSPDEADALANTFAPGTVLQELTGL